jgi:hypothetical protein
MLGGYVILPRLIDKVRLHARGELPPDYVKNLLASPTALDGRFLEFSGIEAEELRKVILRSKTDAEVLAWVEQNGAPHTDEEKREWMEMIDAYRPGAEWAKKRREIYKKVAENVDPATLSVFDLIDLDEGRMRI